MITYHMDIFCWLICLISLAYIIQNQRRCFIFVCPTLAWYQAQTLRICCWLLEAANIIGIALMPWGKHPMLGTRKETEVLLMLMNSNMSLEIFQILNTCPKPQTLQGNRRKKGLRFLFPSAGHGHSQAKVTDFVPHYYSCILYWFLQQDSSEMWIMMHP